MEMNQMVCKYKNIFNFEYNSEHSTSHIYIVLMMV